MDLKSSLILPTRQVVGTKCTHLLHVSFIYNCAMALYKNNLLRILSPILIWIRLYFQFESLIWEISEMTRVTFNDAVHGMSQIIYFYENENQKKVVMQHNLCPKPKLSMTVWDFEGKNGSSRKTGHRRPSILSAFNIWVLELFSEFWDFIKLFTLNPDNRNPTSLHGSN